MSMPGVTSTPNQITVNLGNGMTSTTSYQYNSNGSPTSIVFDSYQNGILTSENKETITYNNGSETVSWTDFNKTLNTSTSGSYTSNY